MRYSEISESFDSAVPVTWHDRSNDDVSLLHAEFQIEDGHFVVQFKMEWHSPNYWEISFTRNGNLELSNTGNAMLVLATVMESIREFIHSKNPRFISFAANKGDRSRLSLYPKLMRKIMSEFPKYTHDKTKDLRNYSEFTLSRPVEYVAPEPVKKEPIVADKPLSDEEFDELMKWMDENKP